MHFRPAKTPSQPTSIQNDMKLRLLTISLISALIALPVLRAQDDAGKKKERKEPQTELGQQMEKISDAYRKLGKQINDASKNADSLQLVATIKSTAEGALKFEPIKKKDLPAADQDKFVADFRAKLKEFIGLTGKLEAALQANDNATAAKLVEEMKNARNDDHKAFEKQKEKKKKA